jgi:hypothetical protein
MAWLEDAAGKPHIQVLGAEALPRHGLIERVAEFPELGATHTKRSFTTGPRFNLVRQYVQEFTIPRLDSIAGVFRVDLRFDLFVSPDDASQQLAVGQAAQELETGIRFGI